MRQRVDLISTEPEHGGKAVREASRGPGPGVQQSRHVAGVTAIAQKVPWRRETTMTSRTVTSAINVIKSDSMAVSFGNPRSTPVSRSKLVTKAYVTGITRRLTIETKTAEMYGSSQRRRR